MTMRVQGLGPASAAGGMAADGVPGGGISTGTAVAGGTAIGMIVATSVGHLLNDTVQSLLPAIYPLLQKNYALSYSQVGLLTLAFQFTASLLQPLVGLSTDKRPRPYSLPVGMAMSLVGLVMLATASSYPLLLLAAAAIGIGSSIFHPEASRVARMASGGRHGLAQSLFQVGGNVGTAIGPLAAAFVVVPRGQGSVGWFSLVAIAGIVLLSFVGRWYARALAAAVKGAARAHAPSTLSRRRVGGTVLILLGLIFSKHLYLVGMSTFYTFYLIHTFGVSIQTAQVLLFVFLGAVAAGTVIGGPVGDRIGRRKVILVSILGVLPFTLLLPFASLGWTCVLTVVIGLILSSAFSAIVVFAQELIPGRVGLISGLFFGFAFGVAGLGAAALGALADHTSIDFVFKLCAVLPALGVLAVLLPRLEDLPKAG